MKGIYLATTLIALPSLAVAHGDAGHGAMPNLVHILSSAAHLWPLAVVAMVAAAVKRPVQRLIKQRIERKR